MTQVVELALNLGKVARISQRFHQVRHTLVPSTRCALEPQFLRRRKADGCRHTYRGPHPTAYAAHVRCSVRCPCKGMCTSCLYCDLTRPARGQH